MLLRLVSTVSPRLTVSARPYRSPAGVNVRFCLASLMALLSLHLWSGLGNAQEAPRSPSAMSAPAGADYFTIPQSDLSGSATFPGYQEPPVVGGYGIKGRIGHEAGNNVGRNQSITYFDLSPYLFQGNLYLFGEGRLAVGNNGRAAGTAGGGLGYFFERLNTVGRFSGWWDGDATRGPTFQQWGLSGEIFTEWVDWRGNWYTPFGEVFAITGQRFEAGSQHFIDVNSVAAPTAYPKLDPTLNGTYLAFQRRVFSATAMGGYDMLWSVPVPNKVAQQINLEVSAGFYHFTPEAGNPLDIWGWRGRLDWDIAERLSHMFLEVMHDKTFKTNVMFGADINYWHHLEHRPRIGHSQYQRLADYVRRRRTVAALEGSFLGPEELAIRPETDGVAAHPYVFYQVDASAAGGGDGSLANPYNDLQTAINNATANGADGVFAQGNTAAGAAYTGPITFGNNANGQGLFVIGEQADPTIGVPVNGLTGEVLLPTLNPGTFSQPNLNGVVGDAVTILPGSLGPRFGGIDITNTTGNALVIDSLAAGDLPARIQDVTIDTASGDGIDLLSNSGTIAFTDMIIQDITGNSLLVDGGTAAIVFEGTNTMTNTAAGHGYAVQIRDAGGNVNLRTLAITDTGGDGIFVGSLGSPTASTANVTFGSATLTSITPQATVPAGGAVFIVNQNGSTVFSGALSITGGASGSGDAFVVESLQPTGAVSTQGALTITSRNGHGIYLHDLQETDTNQATITFNGPVTISGLGTGAGTTSAVLFDSSAGAVDFIGNTSITNSNGAGVQLVNSAGPSLQTAFFLSDGNMTISNIAGTSFDVTNALNPNFLIRTAGTLTINNRSGRGIDMSNFAGTAQYIGAVRVNNQLLDTDIGIRVVDNSGAIAFSNATVDDQRGTTSYSVFVENNTNSTSGVGFGTLNVTDDIDATGVHMQDNALVSIGAGELEVTSGTGIEVLSSDPTTLIQRHDITLSSVTASGSTFGIDVEDSWGRFTVTGNGTTTPTGGTISGMTTAGAFFRNTQFVSLNGMAFNGNDTGIDARDMLLVRNGVTSQLILNNLTVSASANEGIRATDVNNISLSNSIIRANGVTNAQEAIEFLANTSQADVDGDGEDQLLNWRFVLDNNLIADSLTAVINSTDMIYIHTGAGIADPVTVDLFVVNHGIPSDTTNNNGIISNRSSGYAALNVEWQGTFRSTIADNEFTLQNGNGQVGVRLIIDGVSNVDYERNSMSAGGANVTGLQFNFQQRVDQLIIANNVVGNATGNFTSNTGFVFRGNTATAMDLTFAATNDQIFIENNLMQFIGVDSTGIQFSQVVGTNGDTRVAIGGNNIQLTTDFDVIREEGIIFQDVRNLITLVDTGDNFIDPGTLYPFYEAFYIPPGTSQGQISINGSLMP
jgi:hypothetical protein